MFTLQCAGGLDEVEKERRSKCRSTSISRNAGKEPYRILVEQSHILVLLGVMSRPGSELTTLVRRFMHIAASYIRYVGKFSTCVQMAALSESFGRASECFGSISQNSFQLH